jgi:hypothetical protein
MLTVIAKAAPQTEHKELLMVLHYWLKSQAFVRAQARNGCRLSLSAAM